MASLDNIYICNTDSVHYVEYINSSSKRTSQCNGWKNELLLLLFEVLRERRRDDVERVGGITLHSIKQSVRDTVSLAWHGICHTLAGTSQGRIAITQSNWCPPTQGRPSPQSVGGTQMDT